MLIEIPVLCCDYGFKVEIGQFLYRSEKRFAAYLACDRGQRSIVGSGLIKHKTALADNAQQYEHYHFGEYYQVH